jgi:hypothetical protein
MLQRLPRLGNLCGAQADLARFATRIADVEDPKRMTFAPCAFSAAFGMVDGALKQGPAEDVTDVGEAGRKNVDVSNILKKMLYPGSGGQRGATL